MNTIFYLSIPKFVEYIPKDKYESWLEEHHIPKYVEYDNEIDDVYIKYPFYMEVLILEHLLKQKVSIKFLKIKE